jgi:uncharacterized protein involved in exopolysaccharide biosynthesis
MTAPVKAPSFAEQSSAVLFDYQVVRDLVRYVLRSVKRHPLLAFVSVCLITGTAVAAATFLPRQYESKARLLSNDGMLSAPSPYGGPPNELPAIAARERIMSRDNLEQVVRQTNLIEVWNKNRNPVLRFKDRVQQKLFGRWTEDDWMTIMVEVLEKRTKVKAEKGTLEIAVTWPEPLMARQLVEAFQQSFLETQHTNEVATKSEAIGVLEAYLDQANKEVEKAFGALKRVSDERSAAAKKAAGANPVNKEAARAEAEALALNQLKLQLRSKQRALQDLEDWRTRQLSDLRTQHEQAKLLYQKGHPTLAQLEQRIDSVQRDSPQLTALKRDELELSKQIQERGGGVQPNTGDFLLMDGRRFPYVPGEQVAASAMQGDNIERELARDPSLMLAQDNLRTALSRVQDLRVRVEAARIELDTARATYKYSFSVVSPPQTPKSASSPGLPLLVLVGLLGGLLFAFLSCTALDVWRGKICEAWQIHRTLKVPVLSSVRL